MDYVIMNETRECTNLRDKVAYANILHEQINYGRAGPASDVVTRSSNIVVGILVGGHSSRMGTTKALLPHSDGGTFLEYIVSISKQIAGDVVILGNLECVPYSINTVSRLLDRHPGHGPLAGLESLLSYAGSRWCFLIGCDYPLLDVELLQCIASQFENGLDAVTFAAGDCTSIKHPCCAGYHGRVLTLVRKKLRSGKLRMQSLLADVRTKTLTPNIQQRERLLNANTREDLNTIRLKCPSLGRPGTSSMPM